MKPLSRTKYRNGFIKSKVIQNVTTFVQLSTLHFRGVICDGYESSDGSILQCHKLNC